MVIYKICKRRVRTCLVPCSVPLSGFLHVSENLENPTGSLQRKWRLPVCTWRSFFFLTDFFVLPSHVINFVKSNHQSRFPVLDLSIWFWPKLQTNAPVQVWAQDFKILFCSDCFQHSGRMFSVCLSGVGQVLLLKVLFIKSIKSVPKGKLPSTVLP